MSISGMFSYFFSEKKKNKYGQNKLSIKSFIPSGYMAIIYIVLLYFSNTQHVNDRCPANNDGGKLL